MSDDETLPLGISVGSVERRDGKVISAEVRVRVAFDGDEADIEKLYPAAVRRARDELILYVRDRFPGDDPQ